MPKLPRVTAKVFASNAAQEDIGQYGSALSGTKVTTGDIGEIQALPAYETGWRGAVISDRNYPTLQEMNGLQKTFSQQIAYMLQSGMPEWDENTEYFKNQFCRVDNLFYYSLTDNNIANNPVDDNVNWQVWNPVGITNCILEIPQRIKHSFENGVFKLLAGSVLIRPDGWLDKENGIRKFVYETLTEDIPMNISSTHTGKINVNIIYAKYHNPEEVEDLWYFTNTAGCIASDTAPTSLLQPDVLWYDTANNIIKHTKDTGTTWLKKELICFPAGQLALDGPNIKSVLEIFNGSGYFGTCGFADKDIKCLFSNGKISDGSYNNIEYTTENILISNPTGYRSLTSNFFVRADGTIGFAINVDEADVLEPPSNSNLTYKLLNKRENIWYQKLAGETSWHTINPIVVLRTTHFNSAGQLDSSAPIEPINLTAKQNGKWVSKAYTIFSSKTFAVNQSITYDLSSYLPNDGNVYEVLFQSYQRTGNVAGNSTSSVLTSDIFTSYGIRLGRCTTRTASSQTSSGSGILPVGAGRTVTYQNIEANGTSGDCGLVAVGYRKVS